MTEWNKHQVILMKPSAYWAVSPVLQCGRGTPINRWAIFELLKLVSPRQMPSLPHGSLRRDFKMFK